MDDYTLGDFVEYVRNLSDKKKSFTYTFGKLQVTYSAKQDYDLGRDGLDGMPRKAGILVNIKIEPACNDYEKFIAGKIEGYVHKQLYHPPPESDDESYAESYEEDDENSSIEDKTEAGIEERANNHGEERALRAKAKQVIDSALVDQTVEIPLLQWHGELNNGWFEIDREERSRDPKLVRYIPQHVEFEFPEIQLTKEELQEARRAIIDQAHAELNRQKQKKADLHQTRDTLTSTLENVITEVRQTRPDIAERLTVKIQKLPRDQMEGSIIFQGDKGDVEIPESRLILYKDFPNNRIHPINIISAIDKWNKDQTEGLQADANDLVETCITGKQLKGITSTIDREADSITLLYNSKPFTTIKRTDIRRIYQSARAFKDMVQSPYDHALERSRAESEILERRNMAKNTKSPMFAKGEKPPTKR